MKALYLFLLIFSILYSSSAIAQKQLKGKVTDTAGKSIQSANIYLKDAEGNIIAYTRSNNNGEYSLDINQSNIGVSIEALCIGYKKAFVILTDLNKNYDLSLQTSEFLLETVTIKWRPALSVNGDTLNYKTSDFATSQDRSIGDVLKKMPGIEVAESGKISYNGTPISSFYIDGDNLLDDRYNIGTKSIPYGAVGEVQVIQNDQPIKMLRENNLSEEIALNLVIKEDAKLQMIGEATAGLGTPSRFDGNLTAILLKKKVKFINYIKGNNIGTDPGTDVTALNAFAGSNNFLSTGAAGVPTLPQNRSLFNKAGLVNFNNLYNLKKDLRLKANISYLYDERQQQYTKFSETYLPGQVISYTELQNNAINPQAINGQFTLANNSAKKFLTDKLTFNYVPLKTKSKLIINAFSGNQMLKQETFDISNVFNTSWALRAGIRISFTSVISHTKKLESLSINPGLNTDIFNNNFSYAELNQYTDVPTWNASNSASIGFSKKVFSHSYRAGFDIQQQQLNSELYRVQNDQTTELVSQDMVNNLKWLKTKFYISPSYNLTGNKITAGLSVPFSYNLIHYKDEGNVLNKSLRRFFIDPSFNLKYKTGIEHSVSANYAFTNGLGGITQVYRGAILQNYRSLFASDAPISEIKSHNIGAGFEFRKAIQMLFFNVSARYSASTYNTISSSTLNNDSEQHVLTAIANRNRSFLFAANTSKYIFDLKTTISAGYSFRQSTSEQMQNNKFFLSEAQTTTYKATILGKLIHFISWSYNINYTEGNNKAKMENGSKTSFMQIGQQSTLSFTTFKNLYVNVSGDHLFTHKSGQPDLKYLFADMNVNFKLLKLKTDVIFSVTNIANVKTFKTLNLSANSLTSGTYSIPGRVAMLRAIFNF